MASEPALLAVPLNRAAPSRTNGPIVTTNWKRSWTLRTDDFPTLHPRAQPDYWIDLRRIENPMTDTGEVSRGACELADWFLHLVAKGNWVTPAVLYDFAEFTCEWLRGDREALIRDHTENP